MKKVELEIVTLSHSMSQSQNFTIVLGEKNGSRKLPIIIGGYEAQAIAVMLERMIPNRPLTHDLFQNVMESYGIKLKEIVINNLVEGVFFAVLNCEQNGKEIQIDSRTSDAIALAVRMKCPIYTYEFVLQSAGIVLDDGQVKKNVIVDTPESEDEDENRSKLDNYTIVTLNKLLKEALDEEHYEKAAKIRDELKKRLP